MIHLVITHTDQELDWLHALPVPCDVQVYTAQPSVADTLPEGCAVVRVRDSRGSAALMLQHLQALARNPAALRADPAGWSVFAPGDALAHAPALLELMAAHEIWGDVQVLSTQGLQPLPRRLAERDQRDWIGDLPVRPERYCLATLAPLGRIDSEAHQLADLYARRHGLDSGSHLCAHFLALCGFEQLADAAEAADLGVMAPGSVFAVRNSRLLALLARDDGALHRLDALVRCDPLYRQMLERVWLHLLELPFIQLDSLPRPQHVDNYAAISVARVVASIDALLSRTEPRSIDASRRTVHAARNAGWLHADAGEPAEPTQFADTLPISFDDARALHIG